MTTIQQIIDLHNSEFYQTAEAYFADRSDEEYFGVREMASEYIWDGLHKRKLNNIAKKIGITFEDLLDWASY